MAKNSANTALTIGILVIAIAFGIVVVMWFMSIGGQESVVPASTGGTSVNIGTGTSNGDGDSTTPASSELEPQQTDLRILFQPYVVANPNVQNLCITAGGQWFWEPDDVGCKETNIPVTDCSNLQLQAAMQQCAAVGANVTCNPNNAFCKY